MSVAKIILQQLGGNKFLVMTGAKKLVALPAGLMFSLSSRMCKNGANKVLISLDASDLYSVKFFKLFKCQQKEISEHSMIYADQLKALIASESGVALSL